jgi:hypothetical protein
MNTELFIEGHRLDITKTASALMTFSIDDVRDFSARSTTWSKTVILPGTSNNNKAFGHIFQIGRSNAFNSSAPNVNFNFNASKSANVILFQDQMQTFKGVLRLLQINYSNGLGGRVEYEVNLSGNLSALSATLTGKLLEDLDFSNYDQTYSIYNIIQSWDNSGGAGIYYPLIDFGTYSTGKHDWHYRTFRPALFLKEYVDKIFSNANYRYVCNEFQTQRFKKIVIPHSKKELTIKTDNLSNANITSTKNYTFPNPFGSTLISFDSNTGTGFNANVGKNIFTYAGSLTTNIKVHFKFIGTFFAVGFFESISLEIWKNGETGTLVYSDFNIFSPFTWESEVSFSIAPGDTLEFRWRGSVTSTVQITSAEFDIKPVGGAIAIPITLGDMLSANEAIPKNIRQIDFLVGIVKLWNLYLYEDKDDPFLINITPYIDFYSKNTSNAVDWTLKLDRSKPIKSKPMSELNAKIYKFKFKNDNDFYNELYRKRYNEGYGDRTYDSQFEFSSQTQDAEVLFSPTPIVGYLGEDKYYSTIFKRTGTEPTVTEENIDSNIRLLQTKKITGVGSWSITDGTSPVWTMTYYGYAGHLDDPTSPSNDLNFGATKELFYLFTSGNLSNNQFNVYWSGYMAEITDKDSKLITAYFKLDPIDILNLDFSKYIYVDGIAFRLNKIKDYNTSIPSVCQVELLKVSSASYTEAPTPGGPPTGCFLLWSDEQTLDADVADPIVYSDCADNPGDGGGGDDPPPPIVYKLNWSFSKLALAGFFNIYLNGTSFSNLVVASTTNGDSGSFNLTTGDTITVKISGSFGKQKRIFVSNDVDGTINDTTSTLVTHTYTFVVGANKNYSVVGEAKNS